MVSLHAAVLALTLAGAGETVLLDFTASWCGPCRQMAPVVEQLQAAGFPIRPIDVDQHRALADRFQVTGVPCFVLVVDGREVDRIVGLTDAESLAALFQRAGAGETPTVRAQSPDAVPANPGFSPPPVQPPAWGATPPPIGPAPGGPLPLGAPAPTATPPLGAQPSTPGLAPPPAAATARVAVGADDPQLAGSVDPDVMKRVMAASVRIRIHDGGGNSVGSGTIIDAREGEALVLTCGHIFRDSKGQGRITVDTFFPGGPQDVAATMIGYDLDNDVGLVSFRPGVAVTATPVAASPESVRVDDVVVNVGCNHGEPPTARVSRITSLDKFLGPSNVQVAGQPVQGRSGGGLFNRQGEVVGVCNAADPADNEGLYAALKTIHGQFEQMGLATLLLTPPAAGSLAAANPPPVATPPSMSATPPRDMPAEAGLSPVRLASNEQPVDRPAPGGADESQTLSPHEAAALDELRKRADGAEVICIIRSLTDPRAKSEIIVLDRASPAFLKQLAAEHDTQSARHLTGLRQE